LSKRKFVVALVLALCLALTAAGGVWAAEYIGAQGHWAEGQINQWHGDVMANGYPDQTFKLNKQLTRAEFVTVVGAIWELNNTDNNPGFPDVKPGQWYYNNVAAAVDAGIIGGYPDGTFKPNNGISRQEVASILTRMLGLDETTGNLYQFTDAVNIPSWSRGSIGAVAAAGLMVGMPDGSFQPKKGITLAEAIVIADRSKGLLKQGSGIEGNVTLDGQPVSGATVKVYAVNGMEVLTEAETDSNGGFKLALKPGTYDITVNTEEEVGYQADVVVSNGAYTSQDLPLAEGVVFTGTLKDKNGRVADDAPVVFFGEVAWGTTTDNDGKFSLVVPRNGTYTGYAGKPDEDASGLKEIVDNVRSGSGDDKSLGSLRTGYSLGGSGSSSGGSSDPSPKIKAAAMTINPQGENPNIVRDLTIAKNGLSGTIDLSGYNDLDFIIGGTITCNVAAELEVTDVLRDGGADLLFLLGDKDKTQQLVAGDPVALDLISYLAELDNRGDGVSMWYLRFLLGDEATINGKLTYKGETENVSLTVLLNNRF